MKKNLLTISMLFSISAFSQIGINTDTPKATLDIVASPADTSKIDGFIPPRISGNDLAGKDSLYTVAQTGTIVYATAAVSSPTAKTTNVTSVGYYYFDGMVWVKMTAAGVTADNGLTKTGNNIQLGGTLIKNTEIAMSGFDTTFSGSGRIGIGTNSPFSQLSNCATLAANDNSGRGINLGTGINWTSSGNEYAMILNNTKTSGTGSGLFIKTNSPDIFSRPLHVMSGSTDVLTATGNGRVGIGIEQPSNTLDVNGDVRVRTINTSTGNGTTDRRVVADANGVLKTVNNDDYNFFHTRLSSDQTLSSDAITNTVLFNNPIATSPFYTYNSTTGILTFNSPGLYFITYQGGFSDFAAGTHLLLGIINVATGQYIGRGSNWSALARSGTVGQISSYTTMINIPNSGYQVRFMAYAGASGSATLLANESGASGSGSVTNLTIQKTR